MQYQIYKHTLNFKFRAGTSRGILTEKTTWYIKIFEDDPEVFGIGECGPLKGLSEDFDDHLEIKIKKIADSILNKNLPFEKIGQQVPDEYPSIKFGIETALLDLKFGGIRKLFNCGFYDQSQPIPINGLVWMGDKKFMFDQIKNKLDQGFDVIKIKVGAINLDEELELIRYIRHHFSKEQITIRLDANGAFGEDNVFDILNRFSEYDIHSIEQPVKQGQPELMKKVCSDSPVPVALDEELIGVHNKADKEKLLAELRPRFIILKPTLTGGLSGTDEWINAAESIGINWWMTSLLESNIGLNAIAQYTSHKRATLPQGLGTGQLYYNNIPSPLEISNGQLSYDKRLSWDLDLALANPV